MIKRKIYPSDVETYRGLDMGIRPECAVAPKQRGPVIAAIYRRGIKSINKFDML